MDQQKYYEALNEMLKNKTSMGYEVKNVTQTDNSMGDLLGFQFDSEKFGGYVYLWNSGFVGRQLLDYKTGEEIIEDATDQMNDIQISALIDELKLKLE